MKDHQHCQKRQHKEEESKYYVPNKYYKDYLLVILAQIPAGNTSYNLLNKIRKNFYSLYREEQIVFNNLLKSV